MLSYLDLFRVFGRIGVMSFGGPAAQIALMHRELVEDRDWLTEDDFLRALSFCMLLPGPEAMQLATYAGWKKRGVIGGLIGGGLFVIPGAVLIFALAMLYGQFGALSLVQAAFVGIKACVVVIVAQACWRLSKKALVGPVPKVLALFAFVVLWVQLLPYPLTIAIAAAAGALLLPKDSAAPSVPFTWRVPLVTLAIGAVVWGAAIWLAPAGFYQNVALFFSKLAIVTFGGAYAVLAYMTSQVVSDFGWLTTEQMMDALGLAETTPGPLILVTQFVAVLADINRGGNGLAAGLLALWVTFIPCFIWIFAGAPLIDWISTRPAIGAALKGVIAAVVGVIGSLSIWFALHFFFDVLATVEFGSISFIYPQFSSISLAAILLTVVASALLVWHKMSVPLTLFVCALGGIGFSLGTSLM